MAEPAPFDDLIRRVRAGDNQAAAELVRQYEPFIRRKVRYQLKDRRLCRIFDSMDICQSVLGSFFVRTAAGQFALENRDQLVKLLVRMVQNKLASAARRQHRQCRDARRRASDGSAQLKNVRDDSPSPSQLVSGQELLARFRQALSSEENQLADLRSQGFSWAEIAAQLGGAVEARRSQLSRAIERVSRELGLDEA
jgi:RNA polymerase sigma-70 factor (ECF subfamily)